MTAKDDHGGSDNGNKYDEEKEKEDEKKWE